jgi:hypothetical protein
MELIARRPRLTNPFVLRNKVPAKKSYLRKGLRYRKPIMDIQVKLPSPLDSLKQEIMVKHDFDIEILSPATMTFPGLTDITLSGERKPEKYISMREEMIALRDLDNGKYKAMVFQDARNKQHISGFMYIPTVWGAELEPPDNLKRSVLNLAEAVNRFTNIDAKVNPHLMLDSSKLFTMPFLYITTDTAFELTNIEAENLGKYLRNGGFAVLDNGIPEAEYSQAEASLRYMIKDALGKDARFEPIPNSHPLYHCFFDFDDGPPQGNEVQLFLPAPDHLMAAMTYSSLSKPVYYLEGVWIDNRLVVIYSDKGYAHKWKEPDNNIPQLKMGVNMVVFALTQEGGITRRSMKGFTQVQ